MTRIEISETSPDNMATGAGSSGHDADSPIPSIEDRESSNGPSEATSATNNTLSRLRTPSVSVTPPPPSSGARIVSDLPADASGGVRGSAGALINQSESHSVDAAMQHMRLSSPDSVGNLSDIAAAIDAVAQGSDSRGQTLDIQEPDMPVRSLSPRRESRRHRSSSRPEVPPHNVRDETPPEDAFHDPTFQAAYNDGKHLMSNMAEVLSSSSSLHDDPDSTMHRLQEEARDLARFECPSTRKVGFVGDSGVGKSSLLNSLLDTKDLARTSGGGQACTCVVTEFHHHSSDDYAIEVVLFTPDELTAQLAETLQSYRHFHLHQNDMDETERNEFKEKARHAKDTFSSMFRGRLNDTEFLINQPERTVLNTLASWSRECGPSGINAFSSGLTLSGCSDALMQYSSEPPALEEPATWPYIRKIKVFSNAYILSKGLVLVDLPGLRDLNSARQIITERFLLECDEIFAVCNIARAVTDVGVEDVFQRARQAKLSHVGIICTRSDDIQAREAQRDWRDEEAQRVQRLMDIVAMHGQEYNQFTSELNDLTAYGGLSEDDRDDEIELTRLIRSASMDRKNARFALKRYLMETRNAKVIAALQAQYRSRIPNNQLNVFCVSNHDYWEHHEESRDISMPFLRLSGIFEVRRYCISIVSNSQHNSASQYINDRIPALLAQIDLWVQSGAGNASLERKQAIRECLDTLEHRLRRDLESSRAPINRVARSVKRSFEELIYSGRDVGEWTQVAEDAGLEWSGWHHSTYAAFCRRYGEYNSPSAGNHNWNEEVIEGMVQGLQAPWQNFRLQVQNRQQEIALLVEDLTDQATEYLEEQLDDDSSAIDPLTRALVTRQNLLIGDIQQSYDDFEGELSQLRTCALSSVRSSFIGEGLEQTYRDCVFQNGRGSDARRKAIMKARLSQESLFDDLMKKFRANLGTLADELQVKMDESTTSYLHVVCGTLDIIRNENVALEGEDEPDFRERVDAEITAAKIDIEGIRARVSN